MPRKKKDHVDIGLDSLPLNDMVIEAMQGPLYAHRSAQIMGDSLACVVLVAVGDGAQIWSEIIADADSRVRVSLTSPVAESVEDH